MRKYLGWCFVLVLAVVTITVTTQAAEQPGKALNGATIVPSTTIGASDATINLANTMLGLGTNISAMVMNLDATTVTTITMKVQGINTIAGNYVDNTQTFAQTFSCQNNTIAAFGTIGLISVSRS